MSDQSNPFSEYQSPMAETAVKQTATTMTGGRKAICIICVVLGGMGLMSSIAGIGGLFLGKQMQQMFSNMPSGPQGSGQEEVARLQKEMQDEIYAVTDRYFFFNLASGLGQLAISGMLVAGGIMTLTGKPAGAGFLRNACLIALGVELARGILQVVVTMEMIPIQTDFMRKIGEVSGEDFPGEAVAGATQVAMWVGIGVTAFWVLAKAIFYLISALSLSRKSQPAN